MKNNEILFQALKQNKVYFKDIYSTKIKVSTNIKVCVVNELIRLKKGLKTYYYKVSDYGRLWGISESDLRIG